MAVCGLARLLLGVQLVVEAAAPELHQLRLVDAGECLADCTQGLIEIYEFGEWWAICDDRWDEADAEVACRQLDMRGGRAYRGPGSAEAAIAHSYKCGDSCASAVWDNEPHCDGSEARLAECSQTRAAGSCGTSERAGLLCASGPSVGALVAIAVSACAVVAAVVVSCRLAIARARDLKRLDSVTCADLVRSWLSVLRAAPRACLCGRCAEAAAGTGYGRPKRKKTAVRQESPGTHQRGDVESTDALPHGGPRSIGAAIGAAAPAAFSVPRQLEPPLPSQATRPDAAEAKGLRRPLSAGGAERRAAVAQRWIQEVRALHFHLFHSFDHTTLRSLCGAGHDCDRSGAQTPLGADRGGARRRASGRVEAQPPEIECDRDVACTVRECGVASAAWAGGRHAATGSA